MERGVSLVRSGLKKLAGLLVAGATGVELAFVRSFELFLLTLLQNSRDL